VWPEELGKLIKIIHLIGSRTRDLPVCNVRIKFKKNTNLYTSYCCWPTAPHFSSRLVQDIKTAVANDSRQRLE
jgi:hypothetical protein